MRALKKLRSVFKVPDLHRVIKRGKSNSVYEFELEDGTLMPIGTTNALILSSRSLRVAFADKLNRSLPKKFKYKGEDDSWENLLQAILDASEIVETTSEEEETMGWLEAFIDRSSLRGSDQAFLTDSMPLIDLNDKQKLFEALLRVNANSLADAGAKGFVSCTDQRIYLRIETLQQFVNFNSIGAQRVSLQQLSVRLTRLGFCRAQVAARNGDETAKARMYVSPTHFTELLNN